MAIHDFEPDHYFVTIGWHEPALHIADGDTVRTKTLDALGNNQQGEKVGERGNPQTGPFYVEGAEPGDTLVVQIDSIVPNRVIGHTRNVLSENIVDPEYVRELPENEWIEWQVDYAAKTASWGQFTFPVDMMIGCFGVAPPRGEAISTATSYINGGNMDYRGFREGVTVYLPVSAPGALFFLGDCHAVQGDGEIIGTGIEISCDVQFTVQLQKGRTINTVRGENDTHIFAAGNARPLDQATQHATTEIMRWLQSDYGFDATDASVLLGMAVEYDIGNIYDPAYTMVCKMAKRWLP